MRYSLKPGLVRRTAITVTLIAFSLLAGLSSLGVPVASALPPGRHYEMVSPVHKGGFGVRKIGAVSPDGESVAFYSPGVFNEDSSPVGGVQNWNYLAVRGASGWETAPTGAPASLLAEAFIDFSPDLSVEFALGQPGSNVNNPVTEEAGLWLHPAGLPDTVAGWSAAGVLKDPGHVFVPEYISASPDFCHVLVQPSVSKSSEQLLPEAEGILVGKKQLYEIDSGCDGGMVSVALVGVNNQNKIIDRECAVGFGDESYSPTQDGLTHNAISADGSEVFFTTCPSGAHPEEAGSPHQLFVRLAGASTLEVSRPLEAGAFGGCVGEGNGIPGEVPCAGAVARPSADFVGASQDGSRVYFTTTAQLTASDQDRGSDLYMASIGCPSARPGCQASEREVTSLMQVSHDPNGGAAEVQGVMRVARDGQRAYFVATGDLLSPSQRQALEGEGRPVPHVGAENLYAYDSTGNGSVSFVGDLCTATERSGASEDQHCPSDGFDALLWNQNETGEIPEVGGVAVPKVNARESQIAGPNGEYLVFATFAQLSNEDINKAKDIYRYDAETGVLSLVSVGEDGYDPNGGVGTLGSSIEPGNSGGRVFEQYEMNTRAVSEDGSRIVFTSAEPLSPDASNGLVNAYEWHGGPDGQGSVSLVSTGSDPEGVGDVVISPDGSSVFFITTQDLVAQDTDGAPDVYDARLGGKGFPSVAAERQPCEGDGCQGPLTNPAPLLVAGSVSQAPGDDFPPPPATVAPKPKPKSKLCKKGFVKKKNRCIKKAKAKKVGRDRRTKS
jgi:hypothetical protein